MINVTTSNCQKFTLFTASVTVILSIAGNMNICSQTAGIPAIAGKLATLMKHASTWGNSQICYRYTGRRRWLHIMFITEYTQRGLDVTAGVTWLRLPAIVCVSCDCGHVRQQ